jgi:hypothetical protein
VLAIKLNEKKPAIKCSTLGALNKFPEKNTGIKRNVFLAQSFGLNNLI